jgi:hypothetical protein
MNCGKDKRSGRGFILDLFAINVCFVSKTYKKFNRAGIAESVYVKFNLRAG